MEDEQTHQLPEDELGRARSALAMGAGDWSALRAELDRVIGNASRSISHRRFSARGAARRMQGVERRSSSLERRWKRVSPD